MLKLFSQMLSAHVQEGKEGFWTSEGEEGEGVVLLAVVTLVVGADIPWSVMKEASKSIGS